MTLRVAGNQNRLINPEIITMEALYRLRDQLIWPLMANRTWEHVFDEKIGDTINVKRPYYAVTQEGRIMSQQNKMIDRTIQITVDKRFHGGLKFNDEEMTLSIRDFSARYVDPVAEQLAYRFNRAGAQELGLAGHFMEGTPGTAIDVDDVQDVRAHAVEVSIPTGRGGFGVMGPRDVAAITKDVKPLYNPDLVSTAVREHYKGKLAGWRIFEDIFIPYMDVHDFGSATPLVNATGGYEGSQLPTDGWGASAKKILNKGQIIKIAGVDEMQLRSEPRRKTGRQMTFTVTQDVSCNNSGQAVIPISPELNAGTLTMADPAGGAALSLEAFQNVDEKAANNAAITVVGTKGKSYRQSLFFNRDALEYVNIMLEIPDGASAYGRRTDPETGVSISYVSDWDIDDMTTKRRLDVFFGAKSIYEYQIVRHIGSEV